MTQTLTRELTAHCPKLKSDYLFQNPKTGKPIGDIKNSFSTACEDAEIMVSRFASYSCHQDGRARRGPVHDCRDHGAFGHQDDPELYAGDG